MEYKKIIAQNKKALFNYFIEERLEAGIVLKGSEVQSLRQGKASIEESHAADTGNEVFLYNCHIAEYEKANRFNHSTRRPRKLLLHKKEINKIIGRTKIKGYTLVALSMYFNKKNKIKIELGIAKGKNYTIKENQLKKKIGREIRVD